MFDVIYHLICGTREFILLSVFQLIVGKEVMKISDLVSRCSSIFGPNKSELALSKQRQSLIERAEHAEASAFEALAETADIGRERDELLHKVKELEEEIARLTK